MAGGTVLSARASSRKPGTLPDPGKSATSKPAKAKPIRVATPGACPTALAEATAAAEARTLGAAAAAEAAEAKEVQEAWRRTMEAAEAAAAAVAAMEQRLVTTQAEALAAAAEAAENKAGPAAHAAPVPRAGCSCLASSEASPLSCTTSLAVTAMPRSTATDTPTRPSSASKMLVIIPRGLRSPRATAHRGTASFAPPVPRPEPGHAGRRCGVGGSVGRGSRLGGAAPVAPTSPARDATRAAFRAFSVERADPLECSTRSSSGGESVYWSAGEGEEAIWGTGDGEEATMEVRGCPSPPRHPPRKPSAAARAWGPDEVPQTGECALDRCEDATPNEVLQNGNGATAGVPATTTK